MNNMNTPKMRIMSKEDLDHAIFFQSSSGTISVDVKLKDGTIVSIRSEKARIGRVVDNDYKFTDLVVGEMVKAF
jgi:hypothetical protein